MPERTPEIDGKKERILQVVDLDRMGELGQNIIDSLSFETESEIEHLFQVLASPDRSTFTTTRTQVIHQGYFEGRFTDKSGNRLAKVIRMRDAWNNQQGSRYRANYKDRVNPGDRSRRMEYGGKIMDAWFPPMWKHTEGNRLTKVRFYDESRWQDFEIHLDVYVDPPESLGLVLVEFEFKTEEAKQNFNPADYPWLGRELTNEKGWGNSSLATKGLPVQAQISDLSTSPLRDWITFARGIHAAYLAEKGRGTV
jgi:CYTH domain-containing protein